MVVRVTVRLGRLHACGHSIDVRVENLRCRRRGVKVVVKGERGLWAT